MRLAYFGSGYVGQVNAAVQASKGHDVVLVDIREDIVNSINNGEPTIYEEGLKELLSKAVSDGKLRATIDNIDAVKNSDVIFICVGTPKSDDGTINLNAIRSVSRSIGLGLRESSDYKVVVIKSTVLPWVPEKVVKNEIKSVFNGGFGLVMNPEFLKEGVAVNDCLHPDSIVIGGNNYDTSIVSKVYAWSNIKPTITSIKAASLVKYAKNSFLAMKVSFANTIANYCSDNGINSREVLRIMSEDKRISPLFLEPGIGFGGSCFPKDVSALASDMRNNDLLRVVLEFNKNQYKELIKLADKIGLKGKVAVLGLAFKPGTDDIRESPSIRLVNELVNRGLSVSVYDPEALSNAKRVLTDVTFCNSVSECVSDADIVIISVPWKEFKVVKELTNAPIIQATPLVIGDNVYTLGE